MKIKRTIAGEEIEIELTGRELINAYNEKNRDYLRQDVINVLEEDYGKTEEDVENILDDIVSRFEDYKEDSGDWRDDCVAAINDVFAESGKFEDDEEDWD